MQEVAPQIHTHQFLSETIGLTLEYLSDILIDLQTIGDFQIERESAWNRRLAELTQAVGQFVELSTLISQTLKLKTKQSLPLVKESHLSLLYILKAMNQAQVKQDYMALEELIKYELKDNLTQWKIDLIPQFKKLLST